MDGGANGGVYAVTIAASNSIIVTAIAITVEKYSKYVRYKIKGGLARSLLHPQQHQSQHQRPNDLACTIHGKTQRLTRERCMDTKREVERKERERQGGTGRDWPRVHISHDCLIRHRHDVVVES
jgi:hypothetical protein